MGSSGSTPEVRAEPSTTDLAELLQAIERLSGFQHQWRNIDWGQKAALKQRLESFSLSRPHVQFIKILLVGEVGVGKSSFINSVSSALQGRITSGALADSSAAHSSTSFTQRLRTHRVRTANGLLPFALCDTMGLESLAGSLPEDIINAIFGHVKEGYRFDHKNAVAQDSEHYARNPDLCDKAFCVVYIIAADKVNVIDERLVEKFRKIRKIISEKGIPQVIVMTRVDEACPLVKNDLKMIYNSRRIRRKMEMCSDMLGVAMSFIFPVKNYHEEIDTDDDMDVLILKAFEQIVHLADDRLMNETDDRC